MAASLSTKLILMFTIIIITIFDVKRGAFGYNDLEQFGHGPIVKPGKRPPVKNVEANSNGSCSPGKDSSMAHPLDHPFVVKIFYEPLKKGQQHIKCTAAVYNKNWVITSAICAEPSLRRQQGNPTHEFGDIWYGTKVSNKQCNLNDTGIIRYVDEVAVPPGTGLDENGTLINGGESIALIKGNKPFFFDNRQWRAIEVLNNDSQCGTETNPTAFGAWVDASRHGKGLLHRLQVKLQSDKNCQELFSGLDPSQKFCGKLTNQKDYSSSFDNGGPLVQSIKLPLPQAPVPVFRPVLCGVLVASSCERKVGVKEADYFVKVSNHHGWIQETAGEQDVETFVRAQ